MRVIRDFESCPEAYQGAVAALGNFDGVHRGHRAILDACAGRAAKENAPAAVMTFEPHPREFFSPAGPAMRLYPLARKLRVLKDMGSIGVVFLARFDRRLAGMSAASFVHDILHRQLKVRHVVTGYDFAFGKGREGDVAYLDAAAAQLGFGFTALPAVVDEAGAAISSTAIRGLLGQGKMEAAARLLGRPYSLSGRVRHGDARGRELGFPTLNLPLAKLFLPRFGIYAARVRVVRDQAVYDAVASLGARPMFPVQAPLLEAHCFDMRRTLYGETVEVELVEFLRDEAVFAGEDALRRQMEIDCRLAKNRLQGKKVAHG